ncbi:MAG: Bug family tripartite tricarboxylate transporter substrate binding protein [Lautropia sp.]
MTRESGTKGTAATPAPTRRRVLHGAGAIAGALAIAARGTPAAAQSPEWPKRTVRIIVPFGPGSTPDIVARLVAEHLGSALGQAFVVENKPGAGGNIGTAQVARAEPDGYTIGLSITGPLVNNTVLYRSLPYDPFKDLTPLTQAVSQPAVLVVSSSLGVDSARELFDLMKKNPGKYNYASVGNGTVAHLAMELIKAKTGTFAVHIVYPSSPQAVLSILQGDTQMATLAPAAVLPQIKAGKLKALAVTTPERFAPMGDLPTFREIGLPDVQASAWMGFVAPSGIAPDLRDRISGKLREALEDPGVVAKLANVGMLPVASTPAQFAAFMKDELKRWGPVIRRTGLKL